MWDTKTVKTRKKHICEFCCRTIPKGTLANNEKGLWEGEWQHWYSCLFCEKNVREEYAEPQEGISGDEFDNWFYDNCTDCPSCKGVVGSNIERSWNSEETEIIAECSNCNFKWKIKIPFGGVEPEVIGFKKEEC